MSDGEERESVVLPGMGDAAFGALMDALAPEGEGEPPAGTGDAAGQAGGTDPAQPAKPAVGSPTTSSASGAPAGSVPASEPAGDALAAEATGGTADGSPEQPATERPGAVALPTGWTVEASAVLPEFGTLSNALEETITKSYQQQAFDATRGEYERYFQALEKHPRLLVGTDVPAIGKEGMERLRDTADAKEWQDAVRSLLMQEIREQAEQKMEESRGFLDTVHASIDLFKNNPDLIPGTRDFDRELADTFAAMATPYEVRVDGKLQGYSIPVQPIIDNLRAQLKARQTPTPVPPNPAPAPARQVDPPQAGIQSKAGSSGDREDFSTLFGTIGLPHLQI